MTMCVRVYLCGTHTHTHPHTPTLTHTLTHDTQVGLVGSQGGAGAGEDIRAMEKEAALAALERAFVQERVRASGSLTADQPDSDSMAWLDLRVKLASHVRVLGR